MALFKRTLALLGLALVAPSLSACATATSTGSFKGADHLVAQTVANLQSAATAGEAGKICNQLLASAVVARLQASGGCTNAIKRQLSEIDNFEATVESVKLGRTGASETATAAVKSVYGGKKRPSTLALVKEGGRWKISGLG